MPQQDDFDRPGEPKLTPSGLPKKPSKKRKQPESEDDNEGVPVLTPETGEPKHEGARRMTDEIRWKDVVRLTLLRASDRDLTLKKAVRHVLGLPEHQRVGAAIFAVEPVNGKTLLELDDILALAERPDFPKEDA